MANTITTQELEILSNKAISAKSTAYCPYSKFRVGASLLTHSGEYITGANVENVSFPVGTCAERVAFGTAVVNGHKEFKAVAVASDITPGASPCGMCRQFMREFLTPSVPIYMYDGQGGHIVKTMGEVFSPTGIYSALWCGVVVQVGDVGFAIFLSLVLYICLVGQYLQWDNIIT
ncbi:hypothetical protein SI65_08781 [Aspergillus cristatus]|uniref:Cytidine deaminase n=1 Tax=Aspergillus cristatus TaxID=573508 RepID=A0A1E3B4P8_ASPCR|nr:hypothetical protein SI65_08781 [Aspergillus cristatus]